MKSGAMRREAGSALIVTVMILVLLGMIGLAALDTAMRDQQVAGYQNRSSLAFYAAEAGVADAKNRLAAVFATNAVVTFPAMAAAVQLGDAVIFPYGRPRYFGDPAAVGGQAVQYMNAGARDTAGGNDLREGRQQWFNTLWRIQVEGQTADGASSRLDVMATKQLAGGNAY
jgi:hypothetical protein